MICDPLASNGGVHHVKYPLLVARIMIEVWSRRGWRVRGVFVEMNFGIADWQVHELGREPRETQQNPEQQFPDVYERVRESVSRSLDALRIFILLWISCWNLSWSSVCETVVDRTFPSRETWRELEICREERGTGFL